MQEYSESTLLALARSGDKEAFSQLMTRYQPMALYLALRIVGNRENAYELVQEAMLQAYLSLENLRDGLRFKSWFYGIVLNICRNFLRTQKSAVSSLDALLLNTPEDELLGMQLDPYNEIEDRDVMQQAIQQLSQRNQSVTRLYYYDQLSVREISTRLAISVVAVKSRLQQARKELREHLLQHDPALAFHYAKIQRRSISMRTVTVADIIQQDSRSLAILIDQEERRVLPLLIGYSEGQAILSTLQDIAMSTPLTFTFIAHLLQATASELVEVRLEQLKDDTLYAIAKLRQGTTFHEVEARPGDALALAVHTTSPILVPDELMQNLGLLLPPAQGKFSQDELTAILHHLRTKQVLANTSSLSEKGTPYDTPEEPRNLDFRDGTSRWMTGGRDAQNYAFAIDQNIKQSGIGSLTLLSKMADPGRFSAVIQMISAKNYRSKRIRFSALLKTEAVNPRTMLCVYAYSNATVLRQQFSDTGPLLGTNDWQRCTSTLEIPEECQRIGVGMLLAGTGQVWMNEAEFTIVEQTVTQENQPAPVVLTAPYNLDFAQGMHGWDLWQNTTFSYLYGLDSSVKISGDNSLYLRSRNDLAESQVSLQQGTSVEPYRGKRLRITGLIKAQEIAAWGGLWVIVTGAGGGTIFNSNVQQDRNHDLGIVGSHDWQEYEVVLNIPTHGARIHYGIGLMGQGLLWLDHLTFEIVGPEVPATTRS